jgi:ComF family protein
VLPEHVPVAAPSRPRAPALVLALVRFSEALVRCLFERDPALGSSGFQSVRVDGHERMALVVRRSSSATAAVWRRRWCCRLAHSLPIHYRPDLVLDVPLHPARQRERGYNQAALLADSLAQTLGSPRLSGALRRLRPTAPQSGLTARARRQNLANAFGVARPAALEEREVLVVDDVLTTGSTLEACLSVLRESGARARGVALAWAS